MFEYEYSEPGGKSRSSWRYSIRRIFSKEMTSVYVTPPICIAWGQSRMPLVWCTRCRGVIVDPKSGTCGT